MVCVTRIKWFNHSHERIFNIMNIGSESINSLFDRSRYRISTSPKDRKKRPLFVTYFEKKYDYDSQEHRFTEVHSFKVEHSKIVDYSCNTKYCKFLYNLGIYMKFLNIYRTVVPLGKWKKQPKSSISHRWASHNNELGIQFCDKYGKIFVPLKVLKLANASGVDLELKLKDIDIEKFISKKLNREA